MKAPRRRPAPPGGEAARPRVLWTDRALADLEAIADYIARDDPVAAAGWIDQLLDSAVKAARVPLAGRRVPEIGRDDVREVFRRSYRVVYRVGPDRIEVLTFFEGHNLFPEDVAPGGG